MTWIKICGITNLEDARTAVDAGADALGFVFYEKSPRYVDPGTARKIVADLPAKVEKVGVFVNADLKEMETTAELLGLTGIQLHVTSSFRRRGRQETEHAPGIKKYVAFRTSYLMDNQGRFKGFAWSAGAKEKIAAIFLDSGTERQPGGTGKSFDWKKARSAVQSMQKDFNVVVAGGLTLANVAEAIRILKPWGVDVASGVEAKPGKKDTEKVRAFIAAVRAADKVH